MKSFVAQITNRLDRHDANYGTLSRTLLDLTVKELRAEEISWVSVTSGRTDL